MRGVVTTTSPVDPSATGIKMKSSDQGCLMNQVIKIVLIEATGTWNIKMYANQGPFSGKIQRSRHIYKYDPGHRWFYNVIGGDQPLLKNKEQFPALSTVACDILATPASTAPVERIFSCGGEVTRGKRNRLTDKNLKREILLRRNKKYID